MTALANGTAYYFRVAAINDFEAVGPMSNETSATPATPADPGAPTGLTARAGDAQVTLFVDRARIERRSASYQL